jgi:energy-coupling factor transporter ATP-binding protein EcfA2
MADNGTTSIVIEHNLDVVVRADRIIDMGPGAGAEGGTVVLEGAPRELLKANAVLLARTFVRARARFARGIAILRKDRLNRPQAFFHQVKRPAI